MDRPADLPPPAPDSWGGLITFFAFGWIVLVAGVGFVGVWGVDQIAQASGFAMPGGYWPVGTLLLALLLLLPLGGLAVGWRGPRYRALFGVWAWGAAAMLGALLFRWLPPLSTQAVLLGQLALNLALAVLIALHQRGQSRGMGQGSGPLPAALAAGLLLLMPWLLWGALGSWLDLLLNGAVALSLALVAGLLLGRGLMPTLRATCDGQVWNLALGGLGAAGLLLELAVASGNGGSPLLLAFALPLLGWAAAALGEGAGRRWPSVALFVALAAFGPLALTDPNELNLLLNIGSRDILTWAMQALALSLLAGLGLTALLVAGRRGLLRLPPLVQGAAAGSAALAALALFVVAGQPGFYGDRLFVILREQADLSSAAAIADPDARRAAVYAALVAHADQTQAPIRMALERTGTDYQPYYLVNALEVRGGLLHRFWLQRRPEVAQVLASPELRPLPALPPTAQGDAAPPSAPPWGLEAIGAPRVWQELGVRGAGVVVGESDSGVQGDHPELADSYRGRGGADDFNWFDPWNGTSQPTDIGGHGTHTTATAVGNQVGVAPDAEWIGCVNLARNLGNPPRYLDCLQFMLAPFPQAGDPLRDGDPARAADVLNNSWGCPPIEGCDATVMLPAVRALRAAGLFVVASAGNDGLAGCETVADPIALYDEVFSVGAIGPSGRLTEFSSLGPVTADGSGRTKPDIVAPGDDVLSAFPGDSYAALPGTSMAGPHVAGVVALMWSANPALRGNIAQTEQLLIETAQPYDGPFPACVPERTTPNNAVGYGIVDAFAAVQAALALR